MQNRTAPANGTGESPVAIIGIGCRFPGGVTNPDAFWRMMREKTDAITGIPKDRWDDRRFYHPTADKPGKSYARLGGFLREDVFAFDPLFFGISPREAEAMDPQQRYVLQVAYEAFEDAGLPLSTLRGSNTGVFMGGFTLDTLLTQLGGANLHLADAATAASCTMAMLANRVSHAFDLRGPSLAVDTACSASLVATHLALRSVRSGECDVALAGGVTIMTRPEYSIAMSNGGLLSKHGRCMAFDARAEGYTRGEGCGIVVLKPLDRAVADGDHVYAVLRHTGTNQDGATQGISAPSGDAQQALMERVYREAGLTPSDIHVVEAHGTGTQAGDTAECGALDRVVKAFPRREKLVVGSVKTNIGHLEAAAGIAGLIKATLMVERGEVLPNLHFETPNPKIPFDTMALRVPTAVEPWPAHDGPRRAGVNSFGYGGANAHAVVESVDIAKSARASSPNGRAPHDLVLPITAQDERALRALAGRYAARVAETATTADLHDVVHSATTRRSFLRHRACFVGRTKEELRDRLERFAEGGALPEAWYDTKRAEGRPPLVWVFTGMGPQRAGMGRELYATEPVYRDFADRVEVIFRDVAGWSILDAMHEDEAGSRMAETAVAQPANFVLQAGLFELYQHLGLRPDVVTGHSVGEVAAAYASGALSLEDAVTVSVHRSRLQATLAGTGGMLAAGISEGDAAALLRGRENVEIAAVNGPTSVTLAGDADVLGTVARDLEARGVFHRHLTVEVPYHSASMDAIRPELLARLAGLEPRTPATTMVSTVTGEPVGDTPLDAGYWWSNVRHAVRFADAVTRIAGDHPGAVFFEVGPHPVLKTSIRESLEAAGAPVLHAVSLDRTTPEPLAVRLSFARLFALGYDVDWAALNRAPGRFVALPSYPWSLTHYRRQSAADLEALRGRGGHPMLQERVACARPTWETEVGPALFPWLPDHVVDGSVVVPGAAYVEVGLAMAREVGEAGDGSPVALRDLTFERVLVDQESEQTRLQGALDPRTNRFTIHSRVMGQADAWTLHARGRVVQPVVLDSKPVDLDLAEGRTLDVDAFYAALADRGLAYGPRFRTVTALRRLPGRRVVAALERTPSDNDGYLLHPTLLDGAFQSMFALLDGEPGAPAGTGAFVPVAIDRIEVAGNLPDSFSSLARITSSRAEEITGDITLFDATGRTLATLGGVRLRALSRAASADPLEGVFHDLRWVPVEAESPQMQEGLGERTWLWIGTKALTDVASGRPGFGASVAVCPTDPEWRELVQTHLADHPDLTDIVYLAAFNGCGSLNEPHVVDAFAEVTGIVRDLATSRPSQTIRLHVVTRGAHAVVDGDRPDNLVGASLNAFGILVENEHPNLRWQCADVEDLGALCRHLDAILLADGQARERAFRDGREYRRLLVPTHLSPVEPPTVERRLDEGCVVVRQLRSGDMAGFRLEEADLPDPLDHEIQMRIRASSLNYKDLLKAYGTLPDAVMADTYTGATLGMEACGVVTRVGRSVRHLSVGDEVVGVLPDAFRSLANVRADYVIPKPDALSFLEAPVLVAAMTAWYGLIDRAALAEGERVLIHHATGGVGHAALQVARWRGAEIFATAGSEERRAYLRELGVRHVYDSRTTAFAEAILRDTGGRGVDVVLGAVSGEALTESLELLAPWGRFIEIGKKDITENCGLPMRAFQDNVTYAAIDIDRMLAGRPDLVARVLADVTHAFEVGALGASPVTAFPPDRIAEAFQHVANHIGKVVIDFDNAVADIVSSPAPNRRIRRDGTYLVTGGTRGFGLEIAKWLAGRGAGRLVLASRSGASDETRAAMDALNRYGAEIDIRAVDVGSAAEVEALVADLDDPDQPLRGVFHAAAVLEDGFVSLLERDSLERVLRPKLSAALHLHHATRRHQLDVFFCFSSVSALVGNAGQAAYVLANAYLDALCAYRRSVGLAGTSVNWGAIADVGILSRKTDVAGLFERLGLESLSPAEACEVMDRVLTENPPQIGAFRIRWEKASDGMAIFTDPTTRFAGEAGGHAGEGDERLAVRRRLVEACPPEATLESHVLDVVLDRISALLRIPAEHLEPDASIGAMGVDSLTAIELVIHLRRSLGVDFTPIQLLAGPTPLGMRDHVMGALGADQEVSTGAEVIQPAPSDDPEQVPPRRPDPERASRRPQRPGAPPAQRHPEGRIPVPS